MSKKVLILGATGHIAHFAIEALIDQSDTTNWHCSPAIHSTCQNMTSRGSTSFKAIR